MNDYPVLALAYLGDAIYELKIRTYLLEKGIVKVKELQEQSINYVSAKAQAKIVKILIEENFLSQQEYEVFLRGRNHKSHSSKSTDIITYKNATGLETIFGTLYLNNELDRIDQIIEHIKKLNF